MRFRAVMLVCSCALLAACGATAAPGSSSTPTATASPLTSRAATEDPTTLVGSWLVVDAAGAEPGTVLLIGEGLSLWQRCGYLMGSWRVGGVSLFAASLEGGDGSCFTSAKDLTPAWLADAADYAVGTTGVTLLARDGSVVARLRPGGRPTPGPNLAPSLADPPTLTPALKAWLAPAAPLPAALTAATRAQLVGSWVATGPRPSTSGMQHTPAGATLRDDGTYSATDGCNGTTGRWEADADGLVVTSGSSTLIGCDNVDVARWLGTATTAGFDGATLVLVDKDGHELGRLAHA
jgi:heat shock protein HslJ